MHLGEMNNLAGEAAYGDVLKLWRGRLVSQFEQENRGPEWVQNGALMQRTKVFLLTPFPTCC